MCILRKQLGTIMSRQTLNYIWVGPEAKTIAGGVVGHDIIGPTHLYPRIDHTMTKLKFWCLDQHKSHYEKQFNNTAIQVCSIEKYLAECSQKEGEISLFAQQVQSLMQRLIEAEGRGQIRDFVTIKEVFAFFLLFAEGKYILDTNVLPNLNDDTQKIIFPDYETFGLPKIHQRDAGDRVDVWMMYSPLEDRTHAKKSLELFLEKINKIENMFSIMPGYDYSGSGKALYIRSIEPTVMGAVLLGYETHSGLDQSKIHYWDTIEATAENNCVFIEELHLKKYFYNTHKAGNNKGSLRQDQTSPTFFSTRTVGRQSNVEGQQTDLLEINPL